MDPVNKGKYRSKKNLIELFKHAVNVTSKLMNLLSSQKKR